MDMYLNLLKLEPFVSRIIMLTSPFPSSSPSHAAFILLCLLCAIMLFNLGMCDLKVKCSKQDQRTLLKFKQGVIDPSGMLSTWSVEQDCCQWTGIVCESITDRVTELNLPCSTHLSPYTEKEDKSHCLTGEIHISLLQLEFLNYLNLSHNDFRAIQFDSVSLPWSCGDSSYSNLQYLDLSYNDDLHIENLHWLSCFSSLKYLQLSGIDLHRETNWLQTLTMLLPELSELYLYRCHLGNIYPSIEYANFTSLKVLDLSRNGFNSEFPKWLFNLSCDISKIDLQYNILQGQLPQEQALLNLQNMKFLRLTHNKFTGLIPDWLGQLENLQELFLDHNLFSGPIPIVLGNLSSLIALDLSSNQLNGSVPETLWKLSNLEILAIGCNFLTGVVSERNFVKLKNLKHLNLGSPALTCDFNSQWVPPFQLTSIILEHLGAKFPAWIYTQRSLVYLAIYYSRISFKSHKFWNFTAQLEVLLLYYNQIEGNMSDVLLQSKIIAVSSNKLRGGLPKLSPNVTLFDMSNNSLSGPISPLLCPKINRKWNLMFLDISHNLLSGELPDCWMNWKSLVHVVMGDNNFTGKIPLSMSSLSNLKTLDLHENNLFGSIPHSLKNCQKLQILDLSENKFSGNIPNWIWNNIKVLQLRSNQFNGSIPQQICQLSSLIILDFADNRISGPIPNCLHDITALVLKNDSQQLLSFPIENTTYFCRYTLSLPSKGQQRIYQSNQELMRIIDLSHNNLSGTIPPETFTLAALQSLNLSQNQLTGKIASDLSNLKQLESLDLSNNHLSGEIPQSMSTMSFLGVLNLSFNNLRGQIPTGTQLQSFDALSFIGNPELCGAPLLKNCREEKKSNSAKQNAKDEDKSEFLSWLYFGLKVGFPTGFLGVCSVLYFSKKWRHASLWSS